MIRVARPAVAWRRVTGFQKKRTGGAYTYLRRRNQRREGIELAEDSGYGRRLKSGYMREKKKRKAEVWGVGEQ